MSEKQKVFLVFFCIIWCCVFCGGLYAQEEGIIPVIKFKDADIKIVLQSIAEKAVKDGKRVNIVAAPNVLGLVSVSLENVDWLTAMKVVLQTYGYGYEWVEKSIIIVDTLGNLTERRKKVAEAKSDEPLGTRDFTLSFAKVEEIKETIKKILTKERGDLACDTRTNTLIVTDTLSKLVEVEELVKVLDKITPQVLIEAKIIETRLTKEENLGIKWNLKAAASGSKRPTTLPFTDSIKRRGTKIFPKTKTPNELQDQTTNTYDDDGNLINTTTEQVIRYSLREGFPMVEDSEFLFGTLDFSQMQVALDILSQRAETEIVSNPKIVTLDNNPASIHVGIKWPVPSYTYNKEQGSWEISGFEDKDIGVTLNVTPNINKGEYITMKIEPTVSEVSKEIAFGGGTILPAVYTQTTSTSVMIKDGHTIAIGGLIKKTKGDSIQKIPILGDIPLLGYFFKHKSKSNEKRDLLIFITARIVKSDEMLAQQALNTK